MMLSEVIDGPKCPKCGRVIDEISGCYPCDEYLPSPFGLETDECDNPKCASCRMVRENQQEKAAKWCGMDE